MSGPSCKIYFNNEDEYHTIVKIAAQHDMTLPQYVHACVIRTTNEVLTARMEEEAAREETTEEVENDSNDSND